MRFAIIENSVVTNIILADQEFIDELGAVAVDVTDVECNIGDMWNGTSFAPPAPLPPAAPPVWEWYIDIGPFFDRFGAAKMAVLTSADAGVKAILQDTQVRKWVDLKRPDVADALDYIRTKVPALTQALQSSILSTPVASEENLALRKLYFGG